MRKTIPILLATLLACGAAFAQQTEVAYTEDFQSYGKNKNPNGWIDTAIGGGAGIGLYKTDIDPTQGNKGTNLVYGTKQSSGRPDGNTPRIGSFSTLTTKNFSTSGRFEYTGRFIRTNADTRVGLTFCSSYPEKDQYYLIALWSRPAGGVTMQLHSFGAGTPAGTLDSNLTPDVNKWYRFRIQADDLNNATQIRARFWADGAPEPSTWSIQAADSAATRLKAGRIGIWSAVRGSFYVDDLSAKSPVDHTAPVVSLFESDKLLDPAIVTPINHDAILEAKVTDDISGVATITMKVDGVAYTPRTPITVEGIHTVRADATDNVGNTSFLEAKVLVDKTRPVVVFNEGTRTLDATRLETFKFDPKIGITVTDNVSRFTWAATLDGQPYTPGTPITVDAFHSIRVVATDEAQNVTDVTLKILVDKVAPVVVFSESDNVLDPTHLETFRVDPKIAIRITDATSAVTSTITLDGQPYVPGTVISVDAFHDVHVVATDQAGNVTDLTQKILVDKLAPVIAFSENASPLDPAAGVHEFDRNVGIDIKVTDATSQVTSTITLDDAPYVSGTPITTDGFHEIRVIAVDQAGNSNDLTLKILVDKQPPVVVFSESGIVYEPTKTASFARDASIVITVTDATSTPQSTITLDGQPYVSGTPITVEGFHNVRVVAKDESNNVTDLTLKVLVDKTRPTIELFENGVKLDPSVVQKFRRDAKVDIVVKDAVSSATYTATLDGAAYTTGTTINGEATHTLVVHAIDEAGNTAEVEIEIHVDKSAPVVKFSESGNVLDTTKTTPFGRDIHVDIDVTDNLPGVTYTADVTLAGATQPYTTGALIHDDGKHTIAVHAVDVAGNPTEAKVDVLVDQTGPAIELRDGTTLLSTDKRQDFDHLPTINIVVTDVLTTPTYTAKLDDSTTEFASGTVVAEGKHTLVVIATDALGNKTESTLLMLVDKTAPVVTLKVGAEPLPENGKIFNHDIKVDADIVDISETTTAAKLNNNDFALSDTISEEREHDLSVTVTDELHWSTTKTAKFIVDKTPPKISVFESAETPTPLLDGKAFAREIKITATAEDLTQYTLSATIDNVLYHLGDPYSVDGPHVLVVNGVDSADNHSEPITLQFYIDKTAPEVTLLETGEPFPVDKTFTRDIVATITVRSATETTKTSKIDGQPYTLGEPYGVEGHHELVVVVTNIAGVPATAKATFTIDKTKPTIHLFATVAQENARPWVADMKFPADVKVTIQANDNLASPPKTKILLDDQEIADGYLVTREDFHKIIATVTDDGGLTSQDGPFDFVLDKTKPVVKVTVLVDGVAEPLESGDQFNHAITPEITIEDLTATSFTATLARGTGEPQQYDKGTEIAEDGKYSLVITVRDDLNNTTTLDPITFTVDKTPPVVLVKEADVTFEGGKFDRNVTPVVLIQDLTEPTITATLDDVVWTPGTEIAAEGDHVLKITVTDELLWSTVVPPISFTVDKSAPVVVITERGNLLTDGALFNRDAQPKIVVTDTTGTTLTATLDDAEFTSEQLVSTERRHVLKVSATDALHHTTDVPPIAFTVDKTPPVLTLTENNQPLTSGAILDHDVTPHLGIVDLTAVSVAATLDGHDFTLDTPVTAEGAHVLDITVTDAVLWKSYIPNLGFFIDKTAPVVAISVDGKPLASGNEFGATITPKIDITDISATTTVATLDGQPYVPGTPISAEGMHVLAVTVTDAAKWVTTVPPITFAIDTTAPIVKVLEHDVPFESGTKFDRDVEPKIVITDLTKTVINAKLDGVAYTPDTVITAEGNHTLTVAVTDNLGHVTTVPPISFLLDKTAPIVSVVANGTPMQSGAAFLHSVKPEILVTDVSATVVDATLTSAAGVTPFVSGLEITVEGAYTLNVTVTDEVNHVTTVPPISFFVDATAPVVTLLDQHDEVIENDSWYAEAVTPKVTIVDTTPTSTTATLNDAQFTLGTQITAEGRYTLKVKVVDAVGLTTEVPAVAFTIDTTPPAITFLSPLANATLTAREVVVTGDSDDAISVFINGAEAFIDATAKKYVSPPISLLEGPNVISAVAYDRAGNKSEPSITVTLDTRAPEIEITAPPEGACLDATSIEVKGTLFGGANGIKVTAGTAAPVDAAISADGRSWTAAIATPTEGMLSLSVSGSDPSGHTSSIVRTVIIDRTKPVIEVFEGTAPFTATLVNRPVALSVRAKDADANATLEVTLDGAPFVSGTVITTEGLHTLKAKAKDCAGHASDEATVAFRIDLTPPLLSNLVPANGATIGNKPAIAGTVSEPASIVAEGTSYVATVTGNAFTIAPALEEGPNAFSLLATDAAGNQSRLPYAITVKSLAPTVEIVESGAPIPANALFNRDVTPVIRSSDAAATIVATKNGAPFTSGTVISDDGSYTITAKATDAFGHESATATATFRIDKTPPVIHITQPADGATLPSATVAVTGTVSADAQTVSVNGVPATLPGNGTFSATVTLDGFNGTIVAFASDEAGNTAVDQVDVAFQGGGALAILLTSPADKLVTNRPRTIVAGQIITPGEAESLTVNNTATPFDAVGSFLIPDFVLVEGENPITATVKKAGGASNSITVVVTADFTPPVLKVFANSIELAAGARFATSPAIVVEATDNNPGVVTKLTIDGTTIDGAVGTLGDGGHSLTAIARDAAGNEARVDRTFFIGTASVSSGCGLSRIDPVADASVFDSTIHITGRAGGAAAVLIGGVRAELSDGSFCGEATLTEGRNEITIQCANADGTPTSEAPLKIVYYRYLDPVVTITSPASGDVVTNSKIAVTGTVGPGVVEGDVNGVRFTVPDDGAASHNFQVPEVSLAPGLNVIAARAQTTSKRGGVATARVKLLNATPQIAITSPLTGTSSGVTSVDVSGTYANINPSTITVSAGSSVTPTVHALTDTTGTFTIASVTLANNAKTVITAAGRNAAGTLATASIEVEQVPTAPQITIAAPLDNTFLPSTATGTIHVTGTINDVPNASVQVNGAAATLTGTSFSADVAASTTAGGSTPIMARVTLPDGRSATDAARVIRFAGALSVREAFPANDTTDVDPAVVILATVSNPLDGSSVAGAFRVADSANATVAGELFVDRDAISFAPHQALKRGERYTITIAQSLKDAAGATLDAPFSSSFSIGTTAPNTPPTVDPIVDGCFTDTTITGRLTNPGARVQLEVDGVKVTKVSNATGAFEARVTFSGQPGFHSVRVREMGSDGTLSPERAMCVRINCAAPRVVAAALDRNTKKLTIQFSKSMNPATLLVSATGSIRIVPEGATALTGAIAMNATNDTATISIVEALPETSITLTVTRAAKDASGAALAADYTQLFTIDGAPPSASGKGYISGAVYDATKGRQLSNATILIAGEPPTVTNDQGRYASRPLAEGAYTIQASAPGRTTVWRQVVVPVGAGVLPIDIRLTERGPEATANGAAQTLTHGGDTTVTRKVELSLASASLTTGRKVRVTSVGAQSLAGLLPLGWSPLAAAEIVVDDSTDPTPLPGAKLTFNIDAAAVTAATQTLSIVQYDSERDEWRVATAVANVATDGKVAIDLTASGNYALVYPDKAAHLTKPATARAGAVLVGVANPCLTTPEVCLLKKIDFKLDPQAVLPNGRTTATLKTEGAAQTQTYPSGTALQAYIDEQLNLADGRVLVDPPFATDLLVYRDLAGTIGVADFHLAPTAQAAAAMLRDGVDHIRVVDYPGRIDRGTLIGADGGRVPGDDAVTIDIPSGATSEPLHAAVSSLTASDLQSYGSIAGFHIAGGFHFTLTRTAEPDPIDGMAILPTQLVKPARATFSVSPIPTSQVIVVEVLPSTPYGAMFRMIAATTGSTSIDVPDAKVFTTRAATAGVPIEGLVREGRYLILAADAPIAYAYGQVRTGDATGLALANARVLSGIGTPMTATFGVGELTRTGGVFVVPVAATPALPYSLQPRSVSAGDGSVAVATASPAADTFVNFGALVLAAQAPQLMSVTPDGSVELDAAAPFAPQAVFNVAIDPTSVANGLLIRNLTAGKVLSGTVSSTGATVKFTPSEPLAAATQYSITVAPTIRTTTGTPFGRTVTKQFRTRAISTNNSIHPELISITLPDANGKATIRGLAGALPTGAQAIAVRRGRFFIVTYDATVTNADGSFSFDAGDEDPKDRITIDDDIDLRVLDPISKAIVAVIPLTFASEDGRTLIAVPTKTVTITSVDGISITIEAGTFDVRTAVTILKGEKASFAKVPQFDAELNFSGAVQVKFDGIAKKRMQLELPAPAGASADKSYFLGYLGDSIRGPRVELVDSLRLVNGHFTTTLASGNSSLNMNVTALGRGVSSEQVISNPADVKRFLIGVLRSGIYATVDLTTSVGWGLVSGVTAGVDMFWDSYASLFASQFTLIETHGRALIPVAPNKPFQVVGVDASTGIERFRKVYDPIGAGDPLTAVVVPAPVDDQVGPYPVFAAPARFEVVDTAPYGVTLTSVRGLEVKVLGNDVHVKRTEESGWLEVVNVDKTTFASADVPNGSELTVTANQNDRVLISMFAKNVDPFAPLSVTFHQPLYVGASTAPDDVDAYFKAGLIKVEAGASLTSLGDVTDQVEFSMDSQNRRVLIDVDGALQLGRTYRITLSRNLRGVKPDGTPGLYLAQTFITGTTGPQLSDDIHLFFSTRAPGGQLAEMNLTSGVVRDLGINGNIALVAALTGGIQAFDISDPAQLQGTPTPIGKTEPGIDDMWGIASDRHGRIYATGLSGMFGFVRSYRIEDFIPDAAGTTKFVENDQVTSTALVCWRVGASAGLPFTTSATIVSDRPEAIPRKIQVLLQDNEIKVDLTPLINTTPPATPPASIGGGFFKLSVPVAPDPALKYAMQRITIENRTAGLHWSKDVKLGASAAPMEFLARAKDDVYIVRNQMTYGVISLFGYGIGVFDLNAIESNEEKNLGSTSSGAISEKVVLTDVKPCQPNPWVPCSASDYEPKCPVPSDGPTAPFNVPCPIREISLTPESLITTGPDSSSVNVYALDSYRGVLDLTIDPPTANPAPPPEVIPAQVSRHPGLALGRSTATIDSYHQRLLALRQVYLARTGREPRPRFQSISPYLTFDADGNKRDYALITGRDFGVLVVKLDGAPLTADHLVDVIWIPAGAVAVRVIPASDIAVVVDGAGRVLFVNLKKIDESGEVDPIPSCTSTCPVAEMFPTALEAATATTPPLPSGADWFELGADDPRIIWKSAPKTVMGTLAPVIDAETGILFTGDVQATRMRAIAATDPRPRVMVNTGDPAGYRETGAIVPLGIEPPSTVTLTGPDASLSAFRLELTLPGSITESLVAAGNQLRFAIESERTVNAVTGQTPDPLPVSHLRRAKGDGSTETRAVPDAFRLTRLIPYDASNPELYKLRFQRGYNRFVSPWVVALADPRASSRYKWSNWGIGPNDATARKEHGCPNCTRPAWLTGTEGVDFFEIYTTGRFLAVRPEVCRTGDPGCALGDEYFESTNYEYLGQGERLVTRVGTTMADSIRPTYVTTAAQAPPTAGGALQETVFVHSGELMTGAVDHDAGGRAGWNVIFDRTYRSRTLGLSPLARGWDSSIFQRLRELPNRHVEYRDGSGEVWLFEKEGSSYKPPVGLYLKLTKTAEGWRLIDQKFRFSDFDAYGRLVRQTDEFYDGSTGGNAIRYFYDRDSHLVSIVDPVNRATGVYWKDDQLEKIKDWRDREVHYYYDAKGRLDHIEMPKAKNPAYPVYDHSFPSSIPTQFYTYPSPAGDYSDAVELDANLLTIREPGDSAARVTYEYQTDIAKRDMVHFEKWGTSDNAQVKFDFTMPGGNFPSPTKTEVEDALKQKRVYTYLLAPQPKDYKSDRTHATKIEELEVPIWQKAAFGVLPSSVSKNDTNTTSTTRTFEFGFTEGRMTSSKLEGVSSTTYGYDGPLTNNDYVLSSRTVTGTGTAAGLTQQYEREGAFLKSVTSGGDTIDSPEAHKNALTLTAEDGGVRRVTTLYPTGLVKDVRSSAVSLPASGAGNFTHLDYYPPDDSEKYRRGLLQQSTIGDSSAITSLLTYASADTADQSIVGRDVNRHTFYDEVGRVLRVDVTGTDVDTRDEFAYDAQGRLVRHKTKQKATQWGEDRYEYDRVGRMTAHEIWQITVTTGPAEARLSRTEFEYDMPAGKVTTTLPSDGTITRTLDRLGRDREVQADPKNPTSATFITNTNAYDLDGNMVFSTDGSSATAIRYDAVHRAVELKRSDSTSAKKTWDGWFRLRKHEELNTGFVASSEYTAGGKLTDSQTNSLTQQFAWDGAGRTRKVTSNGGAGEPVRESQLVFDSAGRLKESRFGEQGTSTTLGRVFHHLEWLYGTTDQPSQVTSFEDNDAVNYKWNLTHDALGRRTKIENQTTPDFFVQQTFDEVGNVRSVKSPARRGTIGYEHDARGLMTEEKLPAAPGGATAPENKFEYDDNGVLKKYTDATDEPTDTLNDGLGRPLRRTYADGSTEEIFYVGSRTNRFKDRQNRWQHFEYDATGRLFRVTNGTTLLDELTYHADGRLFRWKNAESVVEFDNYDVDGRPHYTKQTRLRPDGTELDSYTQNHNYNGFGQRTSWTMPGTATFGSGDWTTAVQPSYDAAGNVIQLQRDTVSSGSQTLLNAEYRAAGRPNFRTLHANIGTTTPTDIERKYEYGTDGIGRMSAFRVFRNTSLLPDPILLAGSEVQYEGAKLSSARLLGLSNGERTTQWRYDDRGRLTQSAPASTEPVTVSADLADAVIQHLNDADFLKKIEKTVPGSGPDKDFDESDDGHKVEKIDDADEVKYKTADDQENGSLRTEDGRFYYGYDEKARLRRAILKPVSGATSVMQVTYDYNAAGRMIGRRVEVSAYAAQPLPDVPPATLPWKLATDLEMGPDAVLPASTTFVWDPISDQLLGVFEAERNDGGAITIVGKPIRQYLHGGMGLDDPIEVAVAEGSGVARYYPVYDEAGDGGLQTVLTSDASIVARTIIEDPYGDGELAISGPAVDNVTLTATKANDGTIINMVVDVRMTEPIDENTLAAAGKLSILAANDDVITTATQTPTIGSNGYVLRWTIPGASWTALTSTSGAHALSVAVTGEMRSTTFGPSVAILPVDTSTSSSLFTDDHPFELREQLSLITSHFATLPAGGSATDELFELTTLAGMSGAQSASSASRLRSLAGGPNLETADSASALLLTAVFQAQPFSDPFTLKNYVRARWYDPATGTWLGPDPVGYEDSSNLYSFAGGDPVNGRDPSGLREATDDDKKARETMVAAVEKLDADWKKKKQVDFVKIKKVPVERPWWDTSGIAGEYDIAYESVTSGYWGDYQAAKQSIQADIKSFDAAVAEADPDGIINYVPLQGFVTETSKEASARRWSNAWLVPVIAPNAVALARSPWFGRAVVQGYPLPNAFRGGATPEDLEVGRLLRDEVAKLREAKPGVSKDRVISIALLRVARMRGGFVRSVSGAAERDGCVTGECTEFETTPSGRNLRVLDAEAKLLSDLAKLLRPTDTGRIDLFIEKFPCASCDGVIQQFIGRFPKVEVVVHLNP